MKSFYPADFHMHSIEMFFYENSTALQGSKSETISCNKNNVFLILSNIISKEQSFKL